MSLREIYDFIYAYEKEKEERFSNLIDAVELTLSSVAYKHAQLVARAVLEPSTFPQTLEDAFPSIFERIRRNIGTESSKEKEEIPQWKIDKQITQARVIAWRKEHGYLDEKEAKK